MANIIDTLVVELGLDASKFTRGQREAVESMRRLEQDAKKHLDPVEDSVFKIVDAFKQFQGRLLAIGALITGGIGIERLVQDVTRLNSEMGYLSKSLGVSAQEMSKWQAAGATVGASAGEMAQGIAAIQNSLADIQIGKGSPLSAFAYATHQSGQGPAVELYGQNGEKRSPTDILMDISRWAERQPDKAVASRMINELGLGQGMTNMLLLGPQELQKRLKEAEKFAPTTEEISRFQALQKAFADLTNTAGQLARHIISEFAPALNKILEIVTKIIAEIDKYSGNDKPVREETESFFTSTPAGRLWRRMFGGGQSSGNAMQDRFGSWEQTPQGSRPVAPGAGASGGTSVEGSDYLRQQRQSFTDQANDPAMRERLRAIALTEGDRDPTRVIESLANRFGYVNSERAKQGLPPITLDQMTTGAFYGPIRRNSSTGEFDAALSRLRSDSALSERMDLGIRNVSGGSNLTQGFTDQGLPSDPNGWRFPQISHGGNVFNDWNGGGRFGAGDYRNAAEYREQLQRGVQMDAAMRKLPQSQSPSIASALPDWLPGAQANVGASRGLGDTPTFDYLWNSRIGAGAGGALSRGGDSSTVNTNTSSTHIGEMNVTVPHGADPTAYANGIKQELQRFDNVQNANTGLQ